VSLASNPLTYTILILGLLLLLLLGAYYFSSRRSTRIPARKPETVKPAWAAGLSTMAEGEEIASPAAETIESLAQERLQKHPDLAGMRLDFGTASSGELEIWVGAERYTTIESIPDDRIRQAISEAVQAFNRGTAGDEVE
jgi:hypothetical protein